MQIKAVQFRATFTWLNSIVNNGHAACDSNSEQHKVCVEVVKHGHERLILEAERTKCLEENVAETGGGGRGGVEGIPISVAQAQVQKKVTGDLVQG